MGNPVLKGWRYGAFIGAVVGCIGLAIYPVIISPYLFPEKWKQQSKAIREQNQINKESIQPGGMKVWTDPFDRPGKPGAN
ncbi:small integral membrane protein 20 [Eurytemora carolleeae]|uniref:small integral membrane protein 20 n=1 Tax=Eurytemora carolleeae TaxID=1294199 RepID=UPI000C771101|nr:small integral membrane protein 20 [Eurytemora carolleeae]|eukprot:XP_023319849.1 small integral membrane protein 20-like [Eurytemora affinis]